MSKKVLVLGATGAMGQYLVPVLAEKGYQVDAVSLDQPNSQFPNVRNICGNAKECGFLGELLQNNYDGIIDFLIYPTAEAYMKLMSIPTKTEHYIYLSGMKQSELKPLFDGLKMEIERCPKDHSWKVNTRFDEYLAAHRIK